MILDFQIPTKLRKYDRVSILTYQSKCVQNFVDFQRCKRIYGEEYKACNYFMRTAQLLCPSSWIEKWEREVENNVLPYKI
ncbi:putative cytochrome C oxidase polypeptide vib [Schistosoma mansoni]|uniref:putative cytochrome C oxidase polypeptide vib n=1 Tax=Schistosoma mansoni TaxID=6183 RepID=UPI0001A6305E|nr:putative cytochrome C oxidase polypeptide vib [Schistosoma mansoni]|eukprot:XP_018652792.1 putative cytochrome C oxidase polypeptide vib [Schistosoma mansoni]